EKHELIGELAVRCALPGAQLINGFLSTADFNFSSLRARQDRSRHLRERANTKEGELDWFGLLEDFCQRVLSVERSGAPACDLRALQRPERETTSLLKDSPFQSGIRQSSLVTAAQPKATPPFFLWDVSRNGVSQSLYSTGSSAEKTIANG